MPARLRDAWDIREVTYPANWLTLARLLLVLPTIYYLRRSNGRWPALICMAVALGTDALDGPLARYRGEVSRLGKILDPIADKLMIDATAVVLAQRRGFPWWITGLLLFRDAGILLAALLIYRRHAQISTAQLSGKATTVALTVAVLLYTADGERSGKPALYIALLPFSLSFWQYGRMFVRVMRRQDVPDAS